MAFPVLYRCLFINRRRSDQNFGPYQDVDKIPKIISSHLTNLTAVDVIILLLFKTFIIHVKSKKF